MAISRLLPITIDPDEVDASLSDFPMLISRALLDDEVVDPSGSNEAQSDGGDLRFFSDAGTTQQPLEVVSFEHDSSTGADDAEVQLWGLVPSVSSVVGTTVYLGYGSGGGDSQPAASDTYGSQNVWDSGFEGVWHLDEDPSGSAPQILDSTANNNDGTSSGSMTSGDSVAGTVGNKLDFDGSDDLVSIPDSASLDVSSAYTIECIVTRGSGGGGVFGRRRASGDDRCFWGDVSFATFTYSATTDGTLGTLTSVSATGTLSIGDTAHMAATLTGGTLTAYFNGVAGTPATSIGNMHVGASPMEIGYHEGAGFGNHHVDEFRISSEARSAAWLAATHSTCFTPGTFAAAGTPEDAGGGDTITATAIASGEAFGTAALHQSIAPTAIASAEAFGSHALTQLQTIEPTAIGSAEAIGGATVFPTTSVEPTGIASGEALGTAALHLAIAPAAVAGGEAFGAASLALYVSAAAIDSAEAFGAPSVFPTTSIECTGIASGEAVGTPQLDLVLLAASTDSAEALGTLALTLYLSPTGVASGEALGGAELVQLTLIEPTGIATAEAHGDATLSTLATIVAQAIAGAEAFGGAVLVGGQLVPAKFPGAVDFRRLGLTSTLRRGGLTSVVRRQGLTCTFRKGT